MNLRTTVPHLVRKPNRPDPAPVITSPPALVDVIDPGMMTRREAERVLELSFHDPVLYRWTYELQTRLGYDTDEVDA